MNDLLETILYRLEVKIDQRGTIWLDKAYIDDQELYKNIKDDITPELVEIVKYMQEAHIVIEHELEKICNRYRR